MQKIISDFINKQSNGLLILNPPTGYGKTYQAFDYIANQDYDNPDTKKVIFITPYKKNLKESELRDAFERHGNLAQFYKYYMFFDNKVESTKKQFLSIENNNISHEGKLYKIPEEIVKLKSYKKLLQLSHLIGDLQIKKKNSSLEIVQVYDELIQTKKNEFDKFNNDFKKKIVALLKDCKTTEEILDMVKYDKRFKWIGLLYPAIFLPEMKILFMSVDKFLYGIDMIISKNISYSDKNLINNSIIFIDEFDDSRSVFLKYCINRTMNCCKDIDYINLFNRIYGFIKNKDFDDSYWSNSTQSQFVYLKEGFSETFNQFSLNYDIKTINSSFDRNFLFDDGKFEIIAKGIKCISPKVNNEDRLIELRFLNDYRDAKKHSFSLTTMFNEVRYRIYQFIIFCVRNSQELFNKINADFASSESVNSLTYTFDDAIRSVVCQFGFRRHSKDYDYLVDLIRENTPKYTKISQDKSRSITGFIDRSVYSSGFRYFDLEDGDDHVFQTHINIQDLYLTPEKILLDIADNSYVVGLSATALITTCIGNFDLEYLEDVMGSKFYKIPNADIKRLDRLINNNFMNYNNIEVLSKTVGCTKVSDTDSIEDELKPIVSDLQLRRDISEELSIYHNSFYCRRLIKLANAIKIFLNDNILRSMICFLPELYRESSEKHEMLLRILQIDKKRNKNIICLATDDFDNKFVQVKKRLYSGEKLCILTSYNSLGSGQNLTYEAPKKDIEKLVRIYKRKNPKNYKDFDCLYIENPTNVVPNITSKSFNEQQLLESLFYLESCRENGEISKNECSKSVKRYFYSLSEDYKRSNILMETPSYNNAKVRIINQAIGRIVRTNLKNPKILILADEEIVNNVDFNHCSSNYYSTYEMKAVESLCLNEHLNKNDSDKKILNKQLRACDAAKRNIENFLKRKWTPEYVDGWKQLRELVLKYPTISENEEDIITYLHGLYIKFSIPINSYFYECDGDFKEITNISTDHTLSRQVSGEAINLKTLTHIDFIDKLFIKNGYAREFKKSKKILSPIMFNNIYKGALGEVIGLEYFTKFLDIELKDLPLDIYEQFDQRIDEKIYVDFKFWNEHNEFSSKKQREKIFKKLNKCDAKYVFIVNTSLVNGNYKINKSKERGMIIYEIPNIYIKKNNSYYADVRVVEKIRSLLKEIRKHYEQ